MTKKTTRTKKSTKKKGKKKMDMKDLTKLKQDYEKALREKGQEIMKSAVEAFFAANPKINGVAWTQYTPYFNDGDECHFGVHGPSFAVGEIDRNELPSYENDGTPGWFSHAPQKYDMKSHYNAGQDWAVRHNEAVDAALAAYPDLSTVLQKAVNSFSETILVAPEDLFLAAFGDHVRVLLTPDEIHVEEYSHD